MHPQPKSDLWEVSLSHAKQVKDQTLRVRVTAHQLQKLKSHALNRKVTVSHIIHEYIRRLPNPAQADIDEL
jgi:hypothetical protein